jgi:putative ABC transport system permease protein
MSENYQHLIGTVDARHAQLPMRQLFLLAIAGLRARLMRSLVTLMIVVLAVAYLSYSAANNAMILSLARADNEDVSALLRAAKVNVEATRAGDRIDTWLIIMAFLTCLVGIANAMLMSVTERFREIGTMKCLGAENRTVVRLFLIESSLMGVVGSVLGILIGVVISLLVGVIQFGHFTIEYMPYGPVLMGALWSFLSGIFLCLIGAGYPALIAARMRPVEALRVEE